MFSAASVCLFVCFIVCQHDNFRTSKHRMMKPGGRCIVQTSRPSSNLGVMTALGAQPPPKKCGVGLRRWENQRRLSSWVIDFGSITAFRFLPKLITPYDLEPPLQLPGYMLFLEI